MADSWTLTTPDGPYQLNASFSAPKYQAGGVSTPGALRRDGRGAYQRSGDGLATPGPLLLTGRVWRDDQDASLIVAELNAIRDAVSVCTQVVRATTGGTYTYSGLAGGPTPEVTPDGLGGWVVALELWPARAEPAFAPLGAPKFVAVTTGTAFTATSIGSITTPMQAVDGDLLLLRIAGARIGLPGGNLTINTTGWTRVTGDIAVMGNFGAVYQRIANGGDAGALTQFTLGGGATTARWAASISVWRPPNAAAPIEVSAWSTATPNAPTVTAGNGDARLVCYWDIYVDAVNVENDMLPPLSMVARAAFIDPATIGTASNLKVASLIADELITTPGVTGSRGVSTAMIAFGSDPAWLSVASVLLANREH